jgi:hypothetical protein
MHGVQLQRAEVDVRAEFDRASQLPDGGASSAARRVTYALFLESDAPAADVQAAVDEAVAACYTLQSLASPVPLEGRVELNGAPLSD